MEVATVIEKVSVKLMNNLARNVSEKKRPILHARRAIYIKLFNALSRQLLRARPNPRAHTQKGRKSAWTKRERKVPRPVAVARQKQRSHFVFSHSLQPTENHSQEKEKLPSSHSFSPQTTFAAEATTVQTEALSGAKLWPRPKASGPCDKLPWA